MPVKVVNYTAPNASSDFAEGLHDIGFAVLSHHPIDAHLFDRVYDEWRAFFKSPEKTDFAFDEKTHDGFISMALSETAKGYDVKDLKEFYHYYQQGRCPAACKQVTDQLTNELKQLAETLLGWIELHAPKSVQQQLSMPLSDMIKDSPLHLFRVIHYPPLTGREPPNALRAAEHGDINLITLLPAATADGLQVKDRNGQWHVVPTNPGWIVVNIGDMLQECTGHYYPSTLHRVINPVGDAANTSRLSMPYFFHPKDEVVLSNRYTANSYRLERYRELGLAT
jgi:isopenicillin N synthase-like dioxygenase